MLNLKKRKETRRITYTNKGKNNAKQVNNTIRLIVRLIRRYDILKKNLFFP